MALINNKNDESYINGTDFSSCHNVQIEMTKVEFLLTQMHVQVPTNIYTERQHFFVVGIHTLHYIAKLCVFFFFK